MGASGAGQKAMVLATLALNEGSLGPSQEVVTRPITLVNITSAIQSTELSIPLDFASRATQTSRAMLTTKMPTTRRVMPPIPAPQVPQAAHAPASALGGWVCRYAR